MPRRFGRLFGRSSPPPLAPPPSADESDLARLVGRYALRFHEGLEGHGVCSPLGIWLLLAFCAPAAQGEERGEIEQALGCSAEVAAEHARLLFNASHSAVGTALAVWTNLSQVSPAYHEWSSSLPDAVEDGLVPTQAVADEWTRRSTQGLIDAFPVDLQQPVALVFASVLAAKIEWEEAFDLVPASTLGSSAWVPELQRVLRAGKAHTRTILRTEAGVVGVHAARSADNDLLVVSVIADPNVPARTVLAAAHDAAAWVLSPAETAHVAPESLFQLKLGDSAWATITESATTDGRRSESVDAVLPAWSAQTRLDVGSNAASGVHAALDAMIILLAQPIPLDADAVQVARAAYTRLGFEAAAVSAMSFAPTAARPSGEPGVHRHALLRFAHPYAVVAVAVDGDLDAPGGAASPWHGVPVFSAWVTTPDDPDG